MKTSALFVLVSILMSGNCTFAQDSWTQWGGENSRSFTSSDTKISNSPALKELWKRDLGSGYSGVLAEDGKLYTHYRNGDDEIVVCLNAANGETVWDHRYEAKLPPEASKDFGEGPNSTSILIDDRLISVGFMGDMICFNKKNGSIEWQCNLLKDHNCTELGFGYSASPLAYEGNIILPIGGEGKTLMAFRVKDGSVAWSSLDYPISYCTPLLIDVDGMDQLVMSLTDSVISVDAKTGKELWSFPLTNQWDTHAFVPVWDAANSVLFISSFRQSHALKLSRDGEKTSFEPVWAVEKVGIGFTNAVKLGNVVYGTTGGSRAPVMTAFDMDKGEVLWRERGFGIANYVATEDRLIMFDEKGELAIAEPNADELNVVFQQRALDSEKGWTFPTVVGNTLYLRNQKQIGAFELK